MKLKKDPIASRRQFVGGVTAGLAAALVPRPSGSKGSNGSKGSKKPAPPVRGKGPANP